MTHYITLWRKTPPDSILDWDHHVSFHIDDAKQVVANLLKQGVKQYSTYALGDKIEDLSSKWN